LVRFPAGKPKSGFGAGGKRKAVFRALVQENDPGGQEKGDPPRSKQLRSALKKKIPSQPVRLK